MREGPPPGGLRASDDDLENYNASVESKIRSKSRAGLLQLLKIACMKCFGFVPETIDYKFKPLRIINHRDESDLKTAALNRIAAAFDNGFITSETAVEALNAEEVLPVKAEPGEALTLEEVTAKKGGVGPTVSGDGSGSMVTE